MLKLGTIRIFTKVLSKVSKIRNRDAKQKVLSALEKNEYFQRFIHDPVERQQFLKAASPYVKYRFYPKGTAIIELLIVRGKALFYKPKSAEEIAKDAMNYHKSQVIQLYIRYMAGEQLEEKFKKWLSKNELGTKALRRRMTSLTADEHAAEREVENDNFSLVIEEVLKPKNKLLPSHLREFDLSFEEKLLLLSTFGNQGEHLVNGHISLKSDTELKVGETFLEAGLMKQISPNFMIVAAEDTHIVSFAKLDYKFLFASDIRNLKEKIDFLRRIFVEIPRQYIMEMAYYLEEKVLSNSEMVYKEGEDVDAIYMVKHGEIEITTVKEVHSIEESILNEYKNNTRLKNKFTEKQKIMIGRIPAGSIFGEEEVIKRVKCRKYSARALQPATFLYTIRKKIFYEIFEKYFPDVSRMLKDWMDLKYRWREQRIKKEREIAGLRGDGQDASAEKGPIERKKSRIEEESKKPRRTFTRRETEGDGHSDDNAMIMASMIQRLNNISPFNENASNISPNFYFTKSNKSIGMSPRNRSQSKGNSARKGSQDIVENVEGIERQKTRLFLENQPRNKFKRTQVIVHKTTPKGPSKSGKRPSEPALKNSLPAPPILNFDKVKDIQNYDPQPKHKSQPRYEIQGGLGSTTSINVDSLKKITPTSQTSPRFFIVKSFRASNGGSQNSIDAEVGGRRHSTHLLIQKDSDYGAPIVTPNMEFRRGTVAGDQSIKGSDQKLYHNDHRKKVPVFKPAASLQHLDRPENKLQGWAPSTGGSLNHLDSKFGEDTSIVNELKGERKVSGSNKGMQLAKKILFTRINPEQFRVSPRPGTSLVRLKVSGVNPDKHAAE